jgi:hypothetical protein
MRRAAASRHRDLVGGRARRASRARFPAQLDADHFELRD